MKKRKNKKKASSSIIYLTIITLLVLIITGILYFLVKNHLLSAAEQIIKDNLVTKGNGLYADTIATGLNEEEPFSSKYYFKGDQLNNYIIFEGSCWHIINIAQNNTIKIMYIGATTDNKCNNVNNKNLIESTVWNEIGNNTWYDSTIQAQIRNWEEKNNINGKLSLSFNKENSKIEDATWYVGAVRFINQSLSTDIEQERTNNIENDYELPTYHGKLGMITVSDYLKVSCEKGAYASTTECKDNNFLVRDQKYWTMTATDSGIQTAWALKNDGSLTAVNTSEVGYAFYPVIYLKSDIQITGNGSINNPYIVVD